MPGAPTPASSGDPPRSANERLKDSFGTYVSGAVVLSALLHYLALSSGSYAVADYSMHTRAPLEQIELQQRLDVPPPPRDIPRPAVPVLSTSLHVDHDLTIGSVLFEDNPAQYLPPPRLPEAPDLSEQPSFTPHSVKPELRNAAEVQKALEKHYPAALRQAGIGGTTLLWVFIDIVGAVQNTRVVESSGYRELDDAAELVVRSTARFSPAYNREQRVPVWIQIPITFRTMAE